MTGERFLRPSSGPHFINSSESNGGSQPRSTLKQTVKPSGKIAPWKPTSERLSTSNRMTRQGFYQWRSLLTTIPGIQALVIRFLSWTVATILECRIKKMSTPATSPSWRTSFQRNLGSWWLYAKKISTMPRSFKNELIIRESNPKATLLARKFGWIVNILRPNATGCWRQSSLVCSKYFTLSESKPTS